MKKLIIFIFALIFSIGLSYSAIYSMDQSDKKETIIMAKDSMGLAYNALASLGLDSLEIVSVRMTYLGDCYTTLYIVARNQKGGLVNLVITRKKTLLWGTNPWRLLKADKIT